MVIFKRDIAVSIKEASKFFPVIAILGPRQSGKTTLAKKIFKKHNYVNLEKPDTRAAALSDPESFLTTYRNEHGLIIDEFQHVPDLLSYIQVIVDEGRKRGIFILTGSQNFLMNKSISQSLAGRIAIHTLFPLSIHELELAHMLPAEIEEILYTGSYPALYAEKINPNIFYESYLQTYIERDIRQLTQVGDLNSFQKFLVLCAARVGQLLNLQGLANDCDISDKTAKRWLSILQASYIVFLLQPHFNNIGKRIVKTPKLFFYDAGLLSFLLKLRPDELATSPHRGHIFESFIIAEIRKWYYHQRPYSPSIYFWRDKAGHEVDCLIAEGLRMIPIEIKASRTILPRVFENITYWSELAKRNPREGFLVYAGSEKQQIVHPSVVSWQSLDKIFKKVRKKKDW